MSEPFAILRSCHACGQPHYAVDWYERPLVEQIAHKNEGTVEVRACMKCGERLHVWAEDAHDSLGGIRALLRSLKLNEAPLHWATAWSQNGEEPLARAWRYEPNCEALIEFLEWANPTVAWEAVALAVSVTGLSEPVAFRRDDTAYGPASWFSDRSRVDTLGRVYVADRIRAVFEAPTLSDCVRVMRERSRAA